MSTFSNVRSSGAASPGGNFIYMESQVYFLIHRLGTGGDEDTVLMNWIEYCWLNGLYFAWTLFPFSDCHSHCYISLTGIYSVSVTIVVSEQLSSRHLRVDLKLIQELHISHNSYIWNYPCSKSSVCQARGNKLLKWCCINRIWFVFFAMAGVMVVLYRTWKVHILSFFLVLHQLLSFCSLWTGCLCCDEGLGHIWINTLLVKVDTIPLIQQLDRNNDSLRYITCRLYVTAVSNPE